MRITEKCSVPNGKFSFKAMVAFFVMYKSIKRLLKLELSIAIYYYQIEPIEFQLYMLIPCNW